MSRQPARFRAIILPASLIATFIGLIVAAACAPVYTPNAMHTPLMDSAGEIHTGAYLGTGIVSVNASTSITDHILLTGAYSADPIPDTLPIRYDIYHIGHWFWEGGGGWYTRLNDDFKLEILGGFGMGHAAAMSNDSLDLYPALRGTGAYRVEGDYRRVSVQANIGFAPKPFSVSSISLDGSPVSNPSVGSGGLALRASYVWFKDLERDSLSTIHPRALFIEPVLFAHAGWHNVQSEFQAGVSIKALSGGGDFRAQWLFFNVGLHVMLDGLW
jgi:hypothetical protein